MFHHLFVHLNMLDRGPLSLTRITRDRAVSASADQTYIRSRLPDVNCELSFGQCQAILATDEHISRH